jgi:hypothetical protein
MSNKKQTAVEWLYEQLNGLNKPILDEYFQTVFSEAKEMEKQQIIEAFDKGISNGKENDYFILTSYGEQYYNETFNKD